jgi:hypothetical protein
MTASPADTPTEWLERTKSPESSLYGGMRPSAWIASGRLETAPRCDDWHRYWRHVAGVTTTRTTTGEAAAVRSDRPRWFAKSGADVARLAFAAPGCGAPRAVTEVDPNTAVLVFEKADEEVHAACITETVPCQNLVPLAPRPILFQVRPALGDEDFFKPFVFAISSNGLMPKGHIPRARGGERYILDVVGAWQPKHKFVVAPVDAKTFQPNRPLQVSPLVPEGTPVIADRDFGSSGFVAITLPRGTAVVQGRVVRRDPWPQEYTRGVHPAVAVRTDGVQVHVAIWVTSERSVSPCDLDKGLRRLSASTPQPGWPSPTSLVPPRPATAPPLHSQPATRPRKRSSDVFAKWQDRKCTRLSLGKP